MSQPSPPENRVQQSPSRSESTSRVGPLLAIILLVIGLGAFYFLYVVEQQALQSRYLFHVLSKSGEDVTQAIVTRRENIKKAFEIVDPRELDPKEPDPKEPDDEDFESAVRNKLSLIPDIERIKFADREKTLGGGAGVVVKMTIDSGMQFITFHVYEKGKSLATIGQSLETLLRPWISVEGLLESTFVARKTGSTEEVFLREGLGSLTLVAIPQAEAVGAEGETPQEDGNVTGAEIREVEIAGEQYKLFLEPFRVPVAISVAEADEAEADEAEADEAEADEADNTPTNGGRETVWLIGGLVSNAAFRVRTMAVSPTFVIVVFTTVVVLLLLTPYFRVRFIGKREGLNARDVLLLALTMLLGCSLASLAAAHTWAGWRQRETRKTELKQVAAKINSRVTCELDKLEDALLKATVRDWNSEPIQTNLLCGKSWQSYPHFEMVFGVNKVEKQGEKQSWKQSWKGSIKSTTTPLIDVSDRAYLQHARDDDLWLPSRSQVGSEARLLGKFVESIRSKTTGEEFAILSGRVAQEGATDPMVAAIESRLLSLIDPVVLPPYQFCVIDTDGTVQFHSKRRRNLTESFFKSLGSNWELKAAVRQRANRHCSATYRADPIAAYVTPLDGTPWMLVVFSDERVLGYMALETLTISLAVVLLYLTLLVIGGGVLISLLGSVLKYGLPWVAKLSEVSLPLSTQNHEWTRTVGQFLRRSLARIVAVFQPVRSPLGAAHSMWYWPDPNMRHLYVRLLGLIFVATAAWVVGTLTLDGQWWLQLCWFFGPIFFVLVGCALIRIGQSQPSSARDTKVRPGSWPWTYAPVVVGAFLTVGVLPPISFYAAVEKEETAAFEDSRQLELAEKLRDRLQRHATQFREVKLGKESEDRIRSELKLEKGINRSIQNALDVHLAEEWQVEETTNRIAPPTDGKWQQRFRHWLAVTDECVGYRYGTTFGRIAPTSNYSEYASETRSLITRRSNRLNRPESGRLVVADWRPSALSLGKGDVGKDDVGKDVDAKVQIHLDVKGARTFEKPTNGRQSVAVAAVVTGAIIILLLVCPILRMVFARDVKHPRWIDGAVLLRCEFPRQLRLRFPSGLHSEEGSAETLRIGFREVTAAESGGDLVQRVECDLDARGSECEVHLTQFDYGLTDPEVRKKKLALLEYLVTRHNRVVIRSSIDPMFFLTGQLHDRWVGAASDIPLGRWAAALQDFATLRARKDEKELRDQLSQTLQEEPDTVWAELSQEVQDTLVGEGWFNELLETVAKTLCQRPELREYNADDIIEQFEDAAGAHYRRIWWSSSTNEKVLLHRLAEGGFVNWKMKDTVTSLMRRRIIVAAPDFRLMNESFRRFVLQAEPAADIREWEDAAERSTWKRLRVPLVVFLLFVAMFFIVTQRDVFVQVLGVLTMLTAGAPALVRLFSLAMYGRAATSP